MADKRTIAVFLGATIVAAGAGYGVNRGIASFVAPPEPVEPATPTGDSPAAAGQPATETVAAKTVAPRRLSESRYINDILKRNLWDSSKVGLESKGPVGADGEDLSASDLKARLLATIVVDPSEYSSAIIVQDGKEEEGGSAYGIGAKLLDAVIVSIGYDRVMIRRGDGREEFLFTGEEPPKKKGGTSAAPSDEEGGVEKTGENEFSLSRSMIDEQLSDLSSVAKMGRSSLHRGPDGEYDGFRLSAIRRGTLPDQIGIRNGDVVHSVNGIPLNSVQAAMGALQALQNESALEVEITRRGQKTTLSYSIQ